MRKVHNRIENIRGNLISLVAPGVKLGELGVVRRKSGGETLASVLSVDGNMVTAQVFEDPRGISTGDSVIFLGHRMKVSCEEEILGRRFNGIGVGIDSGAQVKGRMVEIRQPSFNPVRRSVPNKMVYTNIPMIDVFNCLVRSQKLPIFSIPGEPYNQLLMRIANQTDADVIIIGGMGLRYDDYQAFIDNAERSGSLEKTAMFIHKATDSSVECMLVPDMALACAEQFAISGKDVLVLLTDMSAFADAIKEISIMMDQVPSNLGYPGSLYSDLASRYEKAAYFTFEDGQSGSITIISVTTMPGGDVTHPIPDTTGYITEGQLYLMDGRIGVDSLSRLKQLVIGHTTREDHGDLANALVRLYAESKQASDRQAMGFRLSNWDEKLLSFSQYFEKEMMDLEVNIPLDAALDEGWRILARCFEKYEVGIKQKLVDRYWVF